MTGSGTQLDPYVIWDVNDLQDVGNGAPYLLSDYYELGQDIDAAATVGWNAGAGFVPIGTVDRFTGSFDGKGHSITDLFIDRPGNAYQGLFGRVRGASISNVVLTSCDITGPNYVGELAGTAENYSSIVGCYVSGSVTGNANIGGLIGDSVYSTITDCHTAVTVLGTSYSVGGLIGESTRDTVTDCSATGNVTGAGVGAPGSYEVGGLIGEMKYGTVTRCYATGNVVGHEWQIGGLIGEAEYTAVIEESYATGDVSSTHATPRRVGGLVGDLEGTIRNSYAIGDVLAVDGDRIGGLVGDNDGGTIENSWSHGHVTGGLIEVGGLVGRNNGGVTTDSFWDTMTSGQANSAGGTGKTTTEMKQISTFSEWDISRTVRANPNNGYPFLSWQIGNSPIWLIPGGGGGGWIPGPGPKPAPPLGTVVGKGGNINSSRIL